MFLNDVENNCKPFTELCENEVDTENLKFYS